MKRVVAIDVRRRAAIADDMAAETPVAAQGLLEEEVVGAGRDAIDAIIGAHDGLDLGFGHSRAEGGEIGVLDVVRGGEDVVLVPARFRAGVDGIMFRRRAHLDAVGIIALQPGDIGDGNAAGQIRSSP